MPPETSSPSAPEARAAAAQDAAASRAALHRVVVVGGGFGGLNVARSLKRAPVELTVIDRRNFHLFQPLLYQVATGGLSPGDISSPIRRALRRQRNARVLLGEVVGLDARGRRLRLRDGDTLPYDTLVVATGATHHYFGHEEEWAPHAPGLKTIEDATEIRRRILLAFERAEREPSAERRRALLTFVIVGAGPTGVELAGAICELARDTLAGDFRRIDPRETRVVLVEGLGQVLPAYPADLAAKAQRALERLGTEVRLGTMAKEIDAEGVRLEWKEGKEQQEGTERQEREDAGGGEVRSERVATQCVLWAAGVRASSLARVLEKEAGAPLDKAGRLLVEPDCTLPGHPEIFALGDITSFRHQGDEPLPGVAPVAMQQGRYVADAIRARVRAEAKGGGAADAAPLRPPPFRYRDKGSLATIGRSAAVADFGRLRFSGFFAWLLWSVVHIFFLIEFQNRVLVSIRWTWNYLTHNRGTRLITGRPGA